MLSALVSRLNTWKSDLENHTLGLVIALVQLERAKRSQRRQELDRRSAPQAAPLGHVS